MKGLCAAIIMGVAACASALTAGESRVDVSGMKEGILLTPGEASSNGKCYNANWMDEEKNKQYIVSSFPAGAEWAQGSCSFTPDKDGKVTIYLRGPWNKEKLAVWTLFDSVSVEGATLANGGFDAEADGWQLWGKDDCKAQLIDNGKSGKGVKVAHDASAVQTLDVKAGKPVKISFWFKSAE